MENIENSFTPEEINKFFLTLDDSVNLINDLINLPERSDETDNKIKINSNHIEIMINKDFIKNTDRDLSTYQDVVSKCNIFLSK